MSILEYFSALERLEADQPIRVPRGSKINYDNVSLEAGRKKGSIKKERPEFDALRVEIKLASARQAKKSEVYVLREKLEKITNEKNLLEKRLFESYNREILLIERLSELEVCGEARYENVLPFKRKEQVDDN